MKENKTEHNKINGFQTKKKVMFLSFLLCAKLHPVVQLVLESNWRL